MYAKAKAHSSHIGRRVFGEALERAETVVAERLVPSTLEASSQSPASPRLRASSTPGTPGPRRDRGRGASTKASTLTRELVCLLVVRCCLLRCLAFGHRASRAAAAVQRCKPGPPSAAPLRARASALRASALRPALALRGERFCDCPMSHVPVSRIPRTVRYRLAIIARLPRRTE
jgi:hypothetical protein